MGRTRFMVVKAKELIKTAVFAVLGVIILVGLIAFFLNMGKHDGAYRDGTYYEEMQLGEETAEIAVTIAEGRIAEVSMEEATEAVAVFYPMLAEVTETVGQAVIENQSAEIAVESENPHSAQAYEDVISDMESRMYAYPQEIIDYLENDPKKPYLLCEYMHDMGNSLGGMNSYMDLLDRFEMYQGGFIWDYIDQALWVKDEVTGRRVLRYGGDFDDRPSDYEFSGNGILFADRSEKPAMQEVRYYYGTQNRNR